jgi:hypothetical protein
MLVVSPGVRVILGRGEGAVRSTGVDLETLVLRGRIGIAR